mmetsp:Transcript_43645/g.115252  ORF Transcript_43645/g.115252 Transcript_43645/m.115252 type:complete len:242 (-) Transcript_43645:106-831(-)
MVGPGEVVFRVAPAVPVPGQEQRDGSGGHRSEHRKDLVVVPQERHGGCGSRVHRYVAEHHHPLPSNHRLLQLRLQPPQLPRLHRPGHRREAPIHPVQALQTIHRAPRRPEIIRVSRFQVGQPLLLPLGGALLNDVEVVGVEEEDAPPGAALAAVGGGVPGHESRQLGAGEVVELVVTNAAPHRDLHRLPCFQHPCQCFSRLPPGLALLVYHVPQVHHKVQRFPPPVVHGLPQPVQSAAVVS